jgi:hypothetical protein
MSRRSERTVANRDLRARARALCAALLAFAAASLAAGTSLAAGARPQAHTAGRNAPVTLSLTGTSIPVPPSFLGLSFEYNELPHFESTGNLFDRMIATVHAQDGSPMFVRLGGRSADQVYWDPPTQIVPSFVSIIPPQWLPDLATLVRRDKLQVEFDLNLAVHSPKMEAAFARAAVKALPRRSVTGFAIGNEPDLYKIQPWLYKERIGSTIASTPQFWNDHYTPREYRRDYRAYARALRRAVPHVALEAPDTAFPTKAWSADVTSLGRYAPAAISIHRYATAYCKIINYKNAPTVSTFLKDGTSAGLADTLHGDLKLAKKFSVQLRVTEMNSVTCGGQKGVADAYSTALWAPDALFEMIRAGVAGVNFHIRPKLPNAPFHIDSNGVEALPEEYSMAMFARMIGPSSQLEGLTPRLPPHMRLKAWAVSSKDGLKLMLINKTPRRIDVRFNLPGAHRTATIVRLLGPSLRSITGVTLAGQSIGSDGRWHGQRVTYSATPTSSGVYRLPVPRYSIEMVKFGHV